MQRSMQKSMPSGARKRLLFPAPIVFLALVAAMTSLGVDTSLPAVPAIEAGLAARAGQGVLASSVFMAGFALMPLVGGPLSDCLGRRRVMLTALMAFALAALGCASAHSMAVLLLFRFLAGCASGMATTLPLAVISDLFISSAARQAMSAINTLSSFMPLVAPALGNAALHLGGWRLLFGMEAAYGCALAACALVMPETLSVSTRRPLRPGAILRNCRALLAEPLLRHCALVYGLAFACTFCFTALSPLILIQRMGLSNSAYAAIFAMNSAGSILGAATGAALARRVAGYRLVLSGLALVAASTCVAAVLQFCLGAAPLALLPAAFLALYGFNLAGPSLLVVALKPAPQLLGTGSGLMRSVFTGMNFATSTILGIFCAHHLQWTEKAVASSMALLAGSALLLFFLGARSHGAISALGFVPEPLGAGATEIPHPPSCSERFSERFDERSRRVDD